MKRYRIVIDRGITNKRFGVIDTVKPLIGQWCHGGVSTNIHGAMLWLEKQIEHNRSIK